MNRSNWFRYITLMLCVAWLVSLCGFSASLIGTLAHELVHKHYAMNNTVITVNYDGSGKTSSTNFVPHDHNEAYFKGDMVMIFIMVITIFTILILVFWQPNGE